MIVFIILTIFFLFINRRLMKKEKYYVPIIIFVLSIIIVGISAFQIVTRENKEQHYEIQTMDNNIVINNSNEYTDVKDTVITDKSYFELDLLRDFAIMNISTVLCIGDIIWNKKRVARTFLKFRKRCGTQFCLCLKINNMLP